ncbi:chromate transporter [Virgibacillus sp. 179-BFC.A HS]|uniref:Chromate transporter n=1 Tax=Tigheibacillus jepli TaxID=3035914 RepID=A0ABU5CK54_9BACI|nr:chromate transporter [Virgibacillus sp. 179-BFC.A HS]MDY0406747.1 chromate transporter [Virgibacillus sp. 179-BFC.A HS]
MLGYGGGLSAIPLMHKEVVKNYKWMDEEEFADILALANTLPGPINTKLSGYIGWRLAGFWGLITCIIATVLPTVVLMILLLTVLNAYKDRPWVRGMAKGVIPIAGVMIGVLAWDFLKKSKKFLGWGSTLIFTAISIIVIPFLGIHPAILIVLLILYALIFPSGEKDMKERKRQVNG